MVWEICPMYFALMLNYGFVCNTVRLSNNALKMQSITKQQK